jgi:hypothetical protein
LKFLRERFDLSRIRRNAWHTVRRVAGGRFCSENSYHYFLSFLMRAAFPRE